MPEGTICYDPHELVFLSVVNIVIIVGLFSILGYLVHKVRQISNKKNNER